MGTIQTAVNILINYADFVHLISIMQLTKTNTSPTLKAAHFQD